MSPPRAQSAPAAAGRSGARKAPPFHVPVAIGATAGLYAASLAGVTFLQSQTDAGLAAARQPIMDAVARVAAQRSSLERDLQTTVRALNAASDAYGTAAERSTSLSAMVASLSAEVSKVTGAASAMQLPTSGLPAAPRAMSITSAPPVVATTGASGKP